MNQLKRTVLTTTCVLLSSITYAETTSAPVSLVKLNISQIHPTQPAVGYRQIAAKLQSYRLDPNKMFDNYCETIGAGHLKTIAATSTLKDINSFECEFKVGTVTENMKTAVLAPNGEYYLTDGHHFVSEIAQVIGLDVPVYLLVTPDMQYIKNMRKFSKEMQKKRLTWLKDENKKLKFDQLPQSFAQSELKNDEYRSMMFFLRKVAFDKPKDAPPFYEFYLADWIRKKVPLNTLNLTNAEDYAEAVKKVSMAMVNTPQTEVMAKIEGKSYTVKDFGVYDQFNEQQYDKLLQPNSKLNDAFAK